MNLSTKQKTHTDSSCRKWTYGYQRGREEGTNWETRIHIHKLLYTYPTLCNPMNCSPPGFSAHGNSPGKNTWVGCHALLSGSSQPRDLSQVSCTAGGFFTVWVTRELYIKDITDKNLLYSRGNSTQFSEIAFIFFKEKNPLKIVDIWLLIYFAVLLKLTQHCKSTILQ